MNTNMGMFTTSMLLMALELGTRSIFPHSRRTTTADSPNNPEIIYERESNLKRTSLKGE